MITRIHRATEPISLQIASSFKRFMNRKSNNPITIAKEKTRMNPKAFLLAYIFSDFWNCSNKTIIAGTKAIKNRIALKIMDEEKKDGTPQLMAPLSSIKGLKVALREVNVEAIPSKNTGTAPHQGDILEENLT